MCVLYHSFFARMRIFPQGIIQIAMDLRHVLESRHDRADAARYNGWLHNCFLNVKPDTAAERPQFQRAAKHLLTRSCQKVRMPHHENTNANVGLRGNKCHPLRHPGGKVINRVDLRSIHLFKFASVFICVLIHGPRISCASIVK